MVVGNVYIFDEDTIIGVLGGLKFQRAPRSILNNLLTPVQRGKIWSLSQDSNGMGYFSTLVSLLS